MLFDCPGYLYQALVTQLPCSRKSSEPDL